MKKFSSLFLLFLLIVSCGKSTPDLIVKGTVKDLKKGTLYLHRIEDTLLIKIDSIAVNGDSTFELQTDLEEPEMYFLTLNDNSKELRSIPFFANKGVTEINTSLKQFGINPEIIGSLEQKKLDEFYDIASRFKDQNLEFIETRLQAQKEGDTAKYNKAEKDAENLLKRKYLYAVNFALNNKTSRVAPYVALSEIYDANIKYLDTIYNTLPDSISSSKYGKELKRFIAERKNN